MLEALNDFLSGKVLIVLIVGLGSYFTLRSRFVQFRHFGHMFGVFKESIRGQAGQLSSFQALMLSLAGRVGAGNIAGVGIAVTLGGPGAVFWMWVTALVGMSSSFFECTLAQVYKRADGDGLYRGGPAYYIQHGLKLKGMAVVFSVLLLVTYGFAFNGLQSYTVTHSLQNAFGFAPQHTGIALAVLLAIVFIGGIKRIAAVSDLLVPVKTLAYIGVTLYVIGTQIEHVPAMLETIFKSAFGLDPAFGGLLGSAIVMGVKRGVFANEAGLGSAPNVAAVAAVKHPGAQGVVQAFSVFLDTFVICTCTALLILLSGFYTPGFEGDGIVLTQNSLAAVVGDWGRLFVSIALSLFVFTCILYSYYLGENSLQFLSRNRVVLMIFRGLVLALVVWGSMQDLSTVFAFADITMTCLAFVNLNDPHIARMGGRLQRKVTYGRSAKADIIGKATGLDAMGAPSLELADGRKGEPRPRTIRLHTPGIHTAQNALAAAAVALAMRVPMGGVAKALEGFRPMIYKSGYARLAAMAAPGGATVLNDTYNSNPDSTLAALATLTAMKPGRGGRRIAVLADMKELGSSSAAEHERIGREIGGMKKVDLALFHGQEMRLAHEAAAAARGNASLFFARKEDLADALRSMMTPADIVLVKGSRGMNMEVVVQKLLTNDSDTSER